MTSKTDGEVNEGQNLKTFNSSDEADIKEKTTFLQLEEKKEDGNVSSKPRAKWDSQIEFIFSCLSFAVGLGNIWRFPYLCYKNGGGAFLIPYFVSLFCMGLPIFLFEMGAGQFSSKGPIRVWSLCPLFEGIGYGMCMLSVYIAIYYNILISWAFFYFFASMKSWVTGTISWSSCDNYWNTIRCRDGDQSSNQTYFSHHDDGIKSPSDEYFHHAMLGVSDGIEDLNSVRLELVGCLLLAWVIVYAALWKGIKSIGKFVYVTALFPYVILLILLVRAATLPGFVDGVIFYITPEWSKIFEIRVWAEACTQIFFSIGVTWGVVITLSSYNQFSNNVYRDAVIVAVGNCVTSVFAGFVIFGIIGFMAWEQNTSVSDVVTSGPGLAFIAYPAAVSKMPLPQLWSVLFFFMLLLLGFGTQISTTETVVTVLLDQFPKLRGENRKWTTLVVCGLLFTFGLSMTTDAGIYIFQLWDFHAATYSAMILGALEIIVVAWIYGADNFIEDLRTMIGFYPPLRLFWKWSWKIVSPLMLLAILLFTMINYSQLQYDGYIYPAWTNVLGWMLSLSSVLLVPVVMVWKILVKRQNVRDLLRPTSEWTGRAIKPQ